MKDFTVDKPKPNDVLLNENDVKVESPKPIDIEYDIIVETSGVKKVIAELIEKYNNDELPEDFDIQKEFDKLFQIHLELSTEDFFNVEILPRIVEAYKPI